MGFRLLRLCRIPWVLLWLACVLFLLTASNILRQLLDNLRCIDKRSILESQSLGYKLYTNPAFNTSKSPNITTRKPFDTFFGPRVNHTYKVRLYGITSRVYVNERGKTISEYVHDTAELFKWCEYKNCRCTMRHEEADAVIVEVLRFDIKDIKDMLPRLDGQLWVAYSYEPPTLFRYLPWERFNHQFHLIASYRRDSHLYVPFGVLRRYTEEEKTHHRPIDKDYLLKKTKTVLWFVSNCSPQSDRARYASELSKYIQIDTYGHCGNLTCPSNVPEVDCSATWHDYKFYLAFENSLCEDYVTEKAMNTMMKSDRWILPVVLGYVDYENYLPPNSYLDVRNFSSAKALAEYLHLLDRNPDMYAKYFDWVGKYTTLQGSEYSWPCNVCKHLNTKTYTLEELLRPSVSFSSLSNASQSCVDPDTFYSKIL